MSADSWRNSAHCDDRRRQGMTALYLPLGRSASRTISTRFATVRRAPMPLMGVSAEFCGHALRSRSVLRICVISSCRVFNNRQVIAGALILAQKPWVPVPGAAQALRIPKSQPFLPGWDLGILSKKGGPMAGTRVFRAGITSARKRSNSHPPADVRRETDHVYAAQSLVAKVW